MSTEILPIHSTSSSDYRELPAHNYQTINVEVMGRKIIQMHILYSFESFTTLEEALSLSFAPTSQAPLTQSFTDGIHQHPIEKTIPTITSITMEQTSNSMQPSLTKSLPYRNGCCTG